MASRQNPFTPGWGTQPLAVVGHQELLHGVGEAYANPDWQSRYANLSLIARRGIGKTVLLTEFHHLATDEGWLVVTEDAGRKHGSFVDRIAISLNEFVESRNPRSGDRVPMGSVGAFGVKVGVDTTPADNRAQSLDLRKSLGEVMNLGSERPAGILMTVDEVHRANEADVNDFGNVVQHLQNEGQPVAVALAGLPVEDGKEPAFLARCLSVRMLDLPNTDIELGFVHTASAAGLSFEPEALTMAVHAAAGHPFMMQLVGWHCSRKALKANREIISIEDVSSSLGEARDEFQQAILKNVGLGLSETDRLVLAAMAIDSVPSMVKVLQQRLGKDRQTVNRYLTRLGKAELVHRVERGVYDFSIPGHRAEVRGSGKYLRLQESLGKRARRARKPTSPGSGLER